MRVQLQIWRWDSIFLRSCWGMRYHPELPRRFARLIIHLGWFSLYCYLPIRKGIDDVYPTPEGTG